MSRGGREGDLRLLLGWEGPGREGSNPEDPIPKIQPQRSNPKDPIPKNPTPRIQPQRSNPKESSPKDPTPRIQPQGSNPKESNPKESNPKESSPKDPTPKIQPQRIQPQRSSPKDPAPSHGWVWDPSGRNSSGAPGGGRRTPSRGGRALESGKLEELLQDLKNELEKRQARNAPQIPEELSQPEFPAQQQQQQEEENQQDNQDVKSSASRGGKVTFQLPPAAAPGSEERICHFSWRSNALKETLRKLQASVTLDEATAHPELELSADGKSVRRGARALPVPDGPERFDYWPFVLGRPSFAGGRHCWAVDVGDGGDWAVGVARDSIARKGRLSLGPQGGIWAVERWGGQVRALTPRRATPVPLRWPPRRVSVHLDCAGGTVAFFDAEAGGLLFLFSRAAFGGERLRPWLWVVGAGSQLRLCP